jgi:putative transposase
MTHVTVNRIPVLVDNFDLLWPAIELVKAKFPYELIAWVVLPDHFHLLLDPGRHDFSGLMRRIKLSFSARLRRRMKTTAGRVWQYRFWDHVIRNQSDMNQHIDYIHYNPVKHGLAAAPLDYQYSSFHDYRKWGYYNADWGAGKPMVFDDEFGE